MAAQAPSSGFFEQTEFSEKVYKSLVYHDGKKLAPFEPKSADAPKYFAFYKSALWCPPCRAFTPKIVKFYKEQKEKGAPVEIIFVSYDRNKQSMAEYMGKYKMTFPAFKHKRNREIVSTKGGGIPNLIVTDADGKKLLDSYSESGKYIGPYEVLENLEKLLKK